MKGRLAYDKGQFKALADSLHKKVDNLEKAIEFRFINVVGPKTVSYAKSTTTFTPQSGATHSSMGFVLAKDNEIIETEGFDVKDGPNGAGGAIGATKGKQYAEELARSSGKGYVLIIVAGMNYDSYVEAKGYNVLTQSGIFLESEVKKMINDILKEAGFK